MALQDRLKSGLLNVGDVNRSGLLSVPSPSPSSSGSGQAPFWNPSMGNVAPQPQQQQAPQGILNGQGPSPDMLAQVLMSQLRSDPTSSLTDADMYSAGFEPIKYNRYQWGLIDRSSGDRVGLFGSRADLQNYFSLMNR